MQSKAQIDQVCVQNARRRKSPAWSRWPRPASEMIYQGAFGKRELGKDEADDRRQRVLDRLDDQGDHRRRAMQLVEQGKLSLDEPIGKLLPELAVAAGARRL